jgi:hypothetical protein
VWDDAGHTFSAQVLGAHFEELCREFAWREGTLLVGTDRWPVTRTRHSQ